MFGGSLGEVFSKIVKIMDLALKTGAAMVGINDSGGARIQEGVVSLGLYGHSSGATCSRSGVVRRSPSSSGPAPKCFVYSPAITDFTVMADQTSHMFIAAGRDDQDRHRRGRGVRGNLAGAGTRPNTKSGVAHYILPTRPTQSTTSVPCCPTCRATDLDDAPAFAPTADLTVTDEDRTLDTIVPDSANQPFSMHAVIRAVLDGGVPRGAAAVRPEHPVRVRAGERSVGRSPTNRCSSPGLWTSTRRRRPPASSACNCTPSTSRS